MNDGEQVKKLKGPLTVLRQIDLPGYSLQDTLRVAEALRDHYGKQATRPLMVAKAMDMSPTSGPFRMIIGASAAYELTETSAELGSTIGLSTLGRRAVAPTKEGDDLAALREAVLKPRIMREFLTRYDGNRLPTGSIALNVLEEMGVPSKATARAFSLILENAEFVGFLELVNGSQYVNMTPTISTPVSDKEQSFGNEMEPEELLNLLEDVEVVASTVAAKPHSFSATNTLSTNKRVFISHGKNKDIVKQLRDVLDFGGFEAVVTVDKESTATPVPDKVMDDMRSCGAGIVNVGAEKTIKDDQGVVHKFLNQNVLIEIGAALALYKRNFILLVEDGAELPSNLQGLYEVRYKGPILDYDATMKLLKAFTEFRSNVN